MMPFYAVGLRFDVVLHVEAENEKEAEEVARADEEDWGQQLSKAHPEVTFVDETE